MSERQDIHIHVENDDTSNPDAEVAQDAAAASFFSAQVLRLIVIVLIIAIIVAALGTWGLDIGGASDAVDPTAAP